MGKITVTNVGKAYKQYPTRWSRLAEWVLPGKDQRHNLKWVMQDVSFEIEPGQAVGIIGINGAGKSTLLKMITGTTQPTVGSIEMTGRVAALLELGMGFHPEFTGRENVYMAGQLLGLKADQITKLMPEIEAFAEIGDYIEQPVRVYSSGMQMRLAFSVATAVRPDILIVDEALSVGDAHFQHKSFDRIREFRKQGTTLLIVSHDKQAIQSICDSAILLNAGRVELQDKPDVVMDYYNALLSDLNKLTISQETQDNGVVTTRSGSGEVELIELSLLDSNNQNIEALSVGQQVILKMVAKSNCAVDQVVFGYMIKDKLGQVIFGETSYDKEINIRNLKNNDIIELHFHIDMNIGVGSYSISTALAENSTHVSRNYEWQDLALVFEVYNSMKQPFIGCSWLNSQVIKI
jgi:lipopolysaccharide transport system ATP-binding protein